MAGANSNIQISDLDFDAIKTNLRTFLRSQDKFKDYDFEGSSLSILLDLLAYNTHYNAYYLNMVANEMFMDTAALRSSVVSHAKVLNYTPRSSIAPKATVSVVSTGQTGTVTIDQYARFQSEPIDGVNYTFLAKEQYSTTAVSGTATFNNVELIQGERVGLTYTVVTATNAKQVFAIPDSNVDTSTLVVQVQKSITNNETTTYTLGKDVTGLNGSSEVYFLQESLNGRYEIYFGDNVIGKKLTDGNIVYINYITTSGSSAVGANNFTLQDSIGGTTVVNPLTAASNGSDREDVDAIRYNAPKVYATQGRAVSTQDYVTILENNTQGYTFDSVTAWSGAENNPPVYGQVFVSAKPTGGYTLTMSQKDRIVETILKPAGILTVRPVMVDPDYTYLQVNANVLYDPKKTTLTANQIESVIRTAIKSFGSTNLDKFDSVFSLPDLIVAIQNADPSIITNDCKITVQKKFYPVTGENKRYVLNYGVPLKRGVLSAGIYTSPTIQYYTKDTPSQLIQNVYIEEVPFETSGINSIEVTNQGFNYTYTPTVEILGDGFGATAVAEVVNGSINKITVTNAGQGYTQAIVNIINDPLDINGNSGSAFAVLDGQFGRLRSYYFDSTKQNTKTILTDNIASVDYLNGTVTFNDFAPFEINDPYGQLKLTATTETNILSSTQNRIITIDPFDDESITVNLSIK